MGCDMVVDAGHVQIANCMDGFFALPADIAAQADEGPYADQQQQGEASD